MSRKPKFTPEEKLNIIQEYINESISQINIAKKYNIDPRTFKDWLARYRLQDASILITKETNRIYDLDTKINAVKDYLSGKFTIPQILTIYNITAHSVLRSWVKVYNSHEGTIPPRKGGKHMTKSVKKTQAQKIEIAKACIESGNKYEEIAEKFGVSYQQAYSWTQKYSKFGEAGLEDRRGKRIKDQKPRTTEEELRVKIAELEHKLYMAEMECTLLKKLKELERRDAFLK